MVTGLSLSTPAIRVVAFIDKDVIDIEILEQWQTLLGRLAPPLSIARSSYRVSPNHTLSRKPQTVRKEGCRDGQIEAVWAEGFRFGGPGVRKT